MLIGSLANRSASDGIDVFPNLGYKKDAFLELSLVSNNFPLSPNKPTSTIPSLNSTASFLIAPCPPSTCNNNNHSNPLVLLALISAVIVLCLEVLLVLSLWTQWGDQLWQWYTEYVPIKLERLSLANMGAFLGRNGGEHLRDHERRSD